MKIPQLLGFPCLTAICVDQGVQGIHHTGAPYGTFIIQDARILLTATEDVRKKLEVQVNRMPEDGVDESREGESDWEDEDFHYKFDQNEGQDYSRLVEQLQAWIGATVHEDREMSTPVSKRKNARIEQQNTGITQQNEQIMQYYKQMQSMMRAQ